MQVVLAEGFPKEVKAPLRMEVAFEQLVTLGFHQHLGSRGVCIFQNFSLLTLSL